MANTIKVLAVDPSLSNTGLVLATVDLVSMTYVVDSMQLIASVPESGKTVRKNSDDLRRTRIIAEALRKWTAGVTWVMAEVPTGAQSARASMSNGMCVGLLASLVTPLIEVTPTEVKVAATGNKTASKRDMINWAVGKHPSAGWLRQKRKGSLELVDKNEHLADAVAVLEAGMRTQEFKRGVALLKTND